MGRFRLRISRGDFEELKKLVLADLPDEGGAFALAGLIETQGCVDILVRRILGIPKPLLSVQNEFHLEVAPQAINGLIALCQANQLGAVICHSHPEGLRYSPSDDYGENRIAKALRNFIPVKSPVASLLLTPDEVTGRVWLPETSGPIPISEITIVGNHVQRTRLQAGARDVRSLHGMYDRQVKAFGTLGQLAIANAKVGIVGVGGTGSAVAEQLARLGVLDLVLIDPDNLESTNITRVYGTFGSAAFRLRSGRGTKVDSVSANLRKINPRAVVRAAPRSVVLTTAASMLLDRDVIFLCTDEHWGRSVVNQIAYQYLIPTINIGVRIEANQGVISHAVGTMDILRPDKPCLWCKKFLTAERIAAESMPGSQRTLRAQEGYVEGLDTKTPSVISFTTTIAGAAVSVFLHILTNYMGDWGDISRLGYDYITGTSMRGATAIDEGCICRRVKGFGDLRPLPTLDRLQAGQNPLGKPP